jgi:hypothetical protein
MEAPRVLCVGDLHVGSFGTWRDAEGRLCWGVDDFDDAYPLIFPNRNFPGARRPQSLREPQSLILCIFQESPGRRATPRCEGFAVAP